MTSTQALTEGQRRCACKSLDAYRCWEARYGPRDWDVGEIEMDGGPCECPCHDEDDDDGQPDEMTEWRDYDPDR